MKLERIQPATLAYWGLASMGLAMIAGIYGTTLPIFYQDYLGLSARWISIASIVYAAWNAVNDPLFGFITDNTRSKLGRRIPYLRFTAPFLALTFFLIWMAPTGAAKPGIFAWMLVTMLLYDTCFTIIGLVQSALLPELSEYEEDRSALQISMALFNLLGFVLGFIIPQIFRPKGGESLAPMRLAMLAVGLLGAALILLLSFRVRERPALTEGQPRINFRDYLALTFTSKSALVIIAGNFMRIFVQAVIMGAVFYLADYLLQMNGILLMAWLLIPMILGIFLTTRVRRKVGVLAAQQIYMVLGGLGLCSVFLLPVSLIPLGLALAGFGMGGPEALTYVLLSQAIDEDELRTGQRREGAFFGTNALLTKPAQSLAIAIPPLILEATGFITREANGGVPLLAQAESALQGIRLYSGLIPGAAFLIGAAVLFLYPLRGSAQQELEQKMLALHKEEDQ